MREGPDTEFDVENEVAFAALAGWEEPLRRALQAYCDHCRRLPPRERASRASVLIDFDLWVHPQGAAGDRPMTKHHSVEASAEYLAYLIRTGKADPYAILGALARECER